MHSGAFPKQYLDDTNLTDKKRKELRLKALAQQIKNAEEEVDDYSMFLCSVSPDQTMVELEALKDSLLCGTQEHAAVRNLSSSIRRSLDKCTTLDSRARWETIANFADAVSSGAVERKAGTDLERVLASGSASPSKGRGLSMPRGTVARTSPLPAAAQSSPTRTPSKRTPLLSPHKDVLEERQRDEEFTSVLGTPLHRAVLDVPAHAGRRLPPHLSVERDDSGEPATYSDVSPARQQQMRSSSDGPSYRDVPNEDDYHRGDTIGGGDNTTGAPSMPLTSHALAQREIRAVERHYESRLDAAHAQWRSERSDLVANVERMERLLKEQFSVEKADLVEGWNEERTALLQQQNELRDVLRLAKDHSRDLEDQLDKLKQVVNVLGQRLESSENRSVALQEQHRALHDTLTRAVASAPASTAGSFQPGRQTSPPPKAVVSPGVASPLPKGTTATADSLRGIGLVGVGDLSGVRSPYEAARSPTQSEAERRRRTASLSSYETVSPGPVSPTSQQQI
jgi:hypothetical protein